ncbi:hypothetical protein B9Z45_13260 [Limnohabitans sp. 2KL-17]|nr:hypothetical protein B9Z45_13260 [Limnohabitans sp. 2KL-17]
MFLLHLVFLAMVRKPKIDVITLRFDVLADDTDRKLTIWRAIIERRQLDTLKWTPNLGQVFKWDTIQKKRVTND